MVFILPVSGIAFGAAQFGRFALDVAPINGWLTVSVSLNDVKEGEETEWKAPLLVLLVFLSLFLAMALLLVLVNKRRHQMLLEVHANSISQMMMSSQEPEEECTGGA